MIIIIANQETKGKLSHRTSERKAIKRTKRPLYQRPLTTTTLICPRPCETKYTFKNIFILIVIIIISKRSHQSHVVQNNMQYKIYVHFPTLCTWKISFLQKGIFIVVIFIYQKESPITWPRDARNPLLNRFLCWQPGFKVSFKLTIMAMIITTTLKMLILPLMRVVFENTFQASACREKERGPRPWRTPALNYKVHKERNNCKFPENKDLSIDEYLINCSTATWTFWEHGSPGLQ